MTFDRNPVPDDFEDMRPAPEPPKQIFAADEHTQQATRLLQKAESLAYRQQAVDRRRAALMIEAATVYARLADTAVKAAEMEASHVGMEGWQ